MTKSLIPLLRGSTYIGLTLYCLDVCFIQAEKYISRPTMQCFIVCSRHHQVHASSCADRPNDQGIPTLKNATPVQPSTWTRRRQRSSIVFSFTSMAATSPLGEIYLSQRMQRQLLSVQRHQITTQRRVGIHPLLPSIPSCYYFFPQ